MAGVPVSAAVAGSPCTNLGVYRAGEGVVPVQASGQGVTYRFNLSWKPVDGVLLYGTASRGFRPGGINRRADVAAEGRAEHHAQRAAEDAADQGARGDAPALAARVVVGRLRALQDALRFVEDALALRVLAAEEAPAARELRRPPQMGLEARRAGDEQQKARTHES